MNDAKSPIFIHSMFRSGSTYIFGVFRRSGAYYCFQESIHEFPFFHRDSIAELDNAGQSNPDLRHPPLTASYFSELQAVHSAWKNVIHQEMIYADGFSVADQKRAVRYLKALVEAAPRRPVFQECRTAFRLTALRAKLKGTHIALWRNPWDQWWSFKAADYFDIANLIFLNAPHRPAVIDRLREATKFCSCTDISLEKQFEFYKAQPLSAEDSYRIFFTLWCLAALEAKSSADIDLSIDLLSSSSEYRFEIAKSLEHYGINEIDFSDCMVPAMAFSHSDATFFENLEFEVLRYFEDVGTPQADLEWLRNRSKLHQQTEYGSRSEGTVLRSLVRKTENRLAEMTSLNFANASSAIGSNERAEHFRRELAEAQLRETQVTAELHRKASEIGQLNLLVVSKTSELGAALNQLEEKASALGVLQDELETKASENGVLLADLENKSAALVVFENEIKQKQLLCDVLHKELADKVADLTALQGEFSRQTSEVITARSELEKLMMQLEAKSSLSRNLEAALSDMEAEQKRLFAHIAWQDDVVSHLQSEQARYAAHIAWQDARLDEIWRSASWKVTAPLRALRRFFHQHTARPRAIAKSGIRRLLLGGIALLARSPLIRELALRILKTFPPLEKRLRRLAASKRSSGPAAPASGMRRPGIDPISPWSGSMEDDVAIALDVLERNAHR